MFEPNYKNIVDSARNKEAKRIPLYEHNVDFQKIGMIMPGAGALGDSRVIPVIQEEDDFRNYPWDDIPELYFKEYSKYFRALREEMPEGMKAIGGVGNGIFECVQELTSFQGLCYIAADDEELYHNLFKK